MTSKKQVCDCKEQNVSNKQNGSFFLQNIFNNRFSHKFNNPNLDILTGKITNLNTSRVNCASVCYATKQDKLSNRHKPTPYRVPYNHYRKSYTCNATECNGNAITNEKIIKESRSIEDNCKDKCFKTTYVTNRLVNKSGVRIRNNGGNYNNYLQSTGRLYKQHSAGILPENTSDTNMNSYKIIHPNGIKNNPNCIIHNQKPNSIYSQIYSISKIPITIRKYSNPGFQTRTSVSSKSRLHKLKHNAILGSQQIKNGYNNCINGQLCSKYQTPGPNTKNSGKHIYDTTQCIKKMVNGRLVSCPTYSS